MLFGAHVSAAGGISTAIDRAEAIGCDAVQVFTQSPRMWRPTAHDPEQVARFRTRREEAGIGAVDAVWKELLRQQADGTARAWLSLAAHGAFAPAAGDTELLGQATRALVDGCAAALAAGGEPDGLREAYEALSLALLQVEDSA